MGRHSTRGKRIGNQHQKRAFQTRTNYFSGQTQLGYKLKIKDTSKQRTLFSIKPYVGAQASRSQRAAYKERDGGPGINTSRGSMEYNSFDAFGGCGFRYNINASSFALKSTLNLNMTRNINNPKMQDKLYFDGASSNGLLMESASLGRVTLGGSLTMTLDPTDKNWKLSAIAQLTKKKSRNTQSYMVRYTYTF